MLPSVKIEDIEAVIKVAERLHFTRASEELHRHQSTVSRSAERVESGSGVELFDRTSHPIRLTRGGVVFCYWVRKGMDAIERAIVEGVRANQPEAAALQVGFTSYLDLDVLAYLENVAKAPGDGFSHEDHSSSSSEVISSVLSGTWDCGFIVSPAATGGLVGVPVYQDPFGLALASDHPLARKRKIGLADLRDLPLIVPARDRNTGFRAWFIERCGAAGVKPKIVQEVGNPNEAWFLASQHGRAALLPRAATKNLVKGATVFRPFAEDDLYAEIQLVFRDGPQPPMLASFVEAVLRMRERMRRGGLPSGSGKIPDVPRPAVKPWTRSAPARRGPRSASA